MDLEQSIVRWNGLKGDVCMPSITGKLARLVEWIDLLRLSSFLPHARNDADCVAQLAISFGDGMNVKTRGLGLADFEQHARGVIGSGYAYAASKI